MNNSFSGPLHNFIIKAKKKSLPEIFSPALPELQTSLGFPGGSEEKNPPANARGLWALGGEDPLEKEMVTHSNIFVWEIPWTEEPGVLQPIGSWRVKHHLVSKHTKHKFSYTPLTPPLTHIAHTWQTA